MADIYTLDGDLTHATVPALFETKCPEFNGSTLTIDLSAVRRSDSAGLALLLEWTRQGTERGTHVVLAHIPAQLRSMIKVSGLSGLLTIVD